MDLRELRNRTIGKSSFRHPWELARFEVVFDLIQSVLTKKSIHTILDIGCGDTFFIEQLSARLPWAHYYGVETAFTPELLNYYAERMQGKRFALFDTLEKAASQIKSEISVVLLLDVIEHIEDDIGFLKSIQKFEPITENTIFVITVPAYQCLFCSHDVFLKHYRRYNNKSLLAVIAEAGLDATDVGYFFSSLLPVRILQVAIERISHQPGIPSTGLVKWNGGELKSNFLKKLLYLDFKAANWIKERLGLNIPGLSNYCLCKRVVS